jgi:hypothetical protein
MRTKLPAEICAEQISAIPAAAQSSQYRRKFLNRLNHLLRGVWSNFFDIFFKSSYEPEHERNLKLFPLDFAQPGAYATDNFLSQARSVRWNLVYCRSWRPSCSRRISRCGGLSCIARIVVGGSIKRAAGVTRSRWCGIISPRVHGMISSSLTGPRRSRIFAELSGVSLIDQCPSYTLLACAEPNPAPALPCADLVGTASRRRILRVCGWRPFIPAQ